MGAAPARSGLRRGAAIATALWQLLLSLAVATVPLVVVTVLVLLLLAWLSPAGWYFSIHARSAVAALELPQALETNWRIEGATLCAAQALPALARLPAEASPCGSARWQAFALPESEGAEQVLVLGGRGAGEDEPIEARLELREDDGLQLSLRTAPGGSLGMLRPAPDTPAVALGNALNLIWRGEARPRDLVLPFVAEQVRVGRDVTWSDAAMLHSGTLSVFTSSEEAAARRSLVEEVQLLPGDQVRLGGSELTGTASGFPPKGFLRFARRPGEDAPALEVVAFGRADSLRVERFGDSGYDFRPGLWARLTHDGRLTIATALLAALVAGLGALGSAREMGTPGPRQAWRGMRDALAGERREAAGR